MFAVLVIEQAQEPLTWAGLPLAIQTWVLAAGGFAAAALLIWLLAQALQAVSLPARQRRPWGRWLLASFVGGVILAVLATALPWIWSTLGWSDASLPAEVQLPVKHSRALLAPLYFLAGFALLMVTLPVLRNLQALRWRRIWALAQLSIKEAVRSKILWVFSFLLLVFLFGSWFLPSRPERQVESYVTTVFAAMSVLLLITAGLLAALSIPADLRRQTIHTIVTKPVERFEIVLGRFVGYTLLMTVVLAVMTLFSLVYVARGVDEEARQESLRARVPLFGKLQVEGGKNVGWEWNYRTWVGYDDRAHRERAVWTFARLPAHLGDRPSIRLEYGFSIFRTWKGRPEDEGKPLFCSFAFLTDRWDPADRRRLQEFETEQRQEYARANRQSFLDIDNRLAEKYGYYEVNFQKVEDTHTLSLEVPGALFKGLSQTHPSATARPPLQIVVKCQSPRQFVGVAQRDLYLLDSERSVFVNFFKGAAGIWLLLCLVIGVAVACSTYLSGVISFLTVGFLLLAGAFLPFITELANRKSAGGGPMEAFLRLSRNQPIAAQLDQSPTSVVALKVDALFSYTLQPLLYFFPNIKRFSVTEYVARGFDIPVEKLLLDGLLPLVGYLLCWAVLAYYLMKSREIAS